MMPDSFAGASATKVATTLDELSILPLLLHALSVNIKRITIVIDNDVCLFIVREIQDGKDRVMIAYLCISRQDRVEVKGFEFY